METQPGAPAVAAERVTFKTQAGRAAGLAILMGALTAACLWVGLDGEVSAPERSAGFAAAALFAWGSLLGLMRLADRRPVIEIDRTGVRDRRTKVDARWDDIRAAHLWIQEADVAKAPWIALDVADVARVRRLHPLWARLRRLTLERWGRPPVLLNLQGLDATPAQVLAAIQLHLDRGGLQPRPDSSIAE